MLASSNLYFDHGFIQKSLVNYVVVKFVLVWMWVRWTAITQNHQYVSQNCWKRLYFKEKVEKHWHIGYQGSAV